MKPFNEDILLISGLYRPETESEILTNSRHVVQVAASAFQWKIVKGIEMLNEKSLTIVNAIFIGSFPKYYKKCLIRSAKWKRSEDHADYDIGFINLFAIKELIRGFCLSKKIRTWATDGSREPKTIIVYSMNTSFIKAALSAKKHNKKIKICLICPDLPEHMNSKGSRGYIFDVIKKMDIKRQEKILPNIDGFVFITAAMNEVVNLQRKPWCVVEGLADQSEIRESNVNNIETKRVLYTGTLDERYGILDLVEAFCGIDIPNIELVICGAGTVSDSLKKYLSSDQRIKYFGNLPREEVLKLQSESFLLVNPRKPEGEYVKYSFPSKIIEYLSSGTPTLMYDLPGVPPEYGKHYISINRFINFQEALESSLSMNIEQRSALGEEAACFIRTEKTEMVQVQKILEVIKKSWLVEGI